jgi:hypothetical protein
LTHWALAERSDGRWATFENCVVVGRQNGKNAWLRLIQLACIYLFRDTTLLHSAHELPTAAEHFRELRLMLDPELNPDVHPELTALLLPNGDSFMTANGKEQIRFRNGARILFRARTKVGGKGLTGDKVFLDEAFSLVGGQLGALIPTLTTKPMAQIYYTSSAPYADSSFLHGLRRRAQTPADDDQRFFFAEWSNEPDVDHGDVAAWARANPGLGIRITEDYIRDEYRALSGDEDAAREFARERLGIPEGTDDAGGPISVEAWRALTDGQSTFVGDPVIALDVSPDRRWATFCAAGRRSDGVGHLERVERKSGTAWVVDYAKSLHDRWRVPIVLDPAGPAGSFVAELAARGVPVVETSTREFAQSCGALVDAVVNATVRHRGQVELADAVAGARQRQVGDVWLWARASSKVDISPLVAATLAWGRLPEPRREVWAVVS